MIIELTIFRRPILSRGTLQDYAALWEARGRRESHKYSFVLNMLEDEHLKRYGEWRAERALREHALQTIKARHAAGVRGWHTRQANRAAKRVEMLGAE